MAEVAESTASGLDFYHYAMMPLVRLDDWWLSPGTADLLARARELTHDASTQPAAPVLCRALLLRWSRRCARRRTGTC